MKKGTIITLVAIAAVAMWLVSAYNGMVTAEEGVQSAWSQVENVYQRRMDLIHNLVNTVKGYASHEAETLEGIVNARSKATQVTVDPENLTPEQLQKFNEAQGELSGALGKLLAITEAYPDLKANQNFLELQAQLEGTENRIATERKKFNESAMGYNTLIRRFPNSIIASIFGFEKKGYFEAQEGAENAPKVEF